MRDIEKALFLLSEEQPPSDLQARSASVLDEVQGYSFDRIPLRFRVMTAVAALAIGLGGGLLPDAKAKASESELPLVDASDLAPSALLSIAP